MSQATDTDQALDDDLTELQELIEALQERVELLQAQENLAGEVLEQNLRELGDLADRAAAALDAVAR